MHIWDYHASRMVDANRGWPMSPWALLSIVPSVWTSHLCCTGLWDSFQHLLFSPFTLRVLTLFPDPSSLSTTFRHIPDLAISSQHPFLSWLIVGWVSYLRHPECPEEFFPSTSSQAPLRLKGVRESWECGLNTYSGICKETLLPLSFESDVAFTDRTLLKALIYPSTMCLMFLLHGQWISFHR